MPVRPLPARVQQSASDAERPSNGNGDDVKMSEEKKEDKVNVGRHIVADLVKAFQTYLDERKWKAVRFSVSSCPQCPWRPPSSFDLYSRRKIFLFALLTRTPEASPLVSLQSLLSLLSSFAAVLDEPGLRATRGDECVKIVAETLLRLGDVQGTEPLRDSLQSYMTARRIDKEIFADVESQAQYEDVRNILGFV